ncbi:uncharacterized protein LOC119833429 [Zerene cesonia]|uniref:uncharacterized protein LOC119833429 n=1 Tax=Zerene cesonia TaxID=33412 RepID=UPI0018E4DC11|nr:uncharacterized protein LOC119833429 [Zerene cesonia]
MKTYLVVLFFVVVAFVAALEVEDVSSPHLVQKRQITKPQTIFVKPPPGCIFYECIAKCRQRGHQNGGYCTINGCVCLR